MSESTQIAVPVDFNDLMQKAAQEAMSQEKADNKFISFKSGMLAFNGQVAPGNKILCVVVAAAHENTYYAEKYDPKKLRSPDCWAVALGEEDMAPKADKVGKPQNATCDGCPMNEWESDPNGGKGKACKNTRRLALILASDLDNALGADVMYARLPVTSVKNWSKYVTQIGSVVKRPSWAVITELSVVPDVKSQFKVNFNFNALVPDAQLEAACALSERMRTDILFDYDKNSDDEPAPAPAKGKAKF